MQLHVHQGVEGHSRASRRPMQWSRTARPAIPSGTQQGLGAVAALEAALSLLQWPHCVSGARRLPAAGAWRVGRHSSLPTGLLPALAAVLMSRRLCEMGLANECTTASIAEHHAAVHASTT